MKVWSGLPLCPHYDIAATCNCAWHGGESELATLALHRPPRPAPPPALSTPPQPQHTHSSAFWHNTRHSADTVFPSPCLATLPPTQAEFHMENLPEEAALLVAFSVATIHWQWARATAHDRWKYNVSLESAVFHPSVFSLYNAQCKSGHCCSDANHQAEVRCLGCSGHLQPPPVTTPASVLWPDLTISYNLTTLKCKACK